MPEDAVQPVAVLRADRGIYLDLRVLAVVRPPRVVAALSHASVLPSEHQAVRTVVLHRLAVVTLPVLVAVFVVADYA